MKTVKATYSKRREDIMNQLGLSFTVKNNNIVHKTDSNESLVSILVSQESKKRDSGMYDEQ